ncbi:MAG: hypothetical protein KAI72_08015, partial [Candidatus Pacebacteria bacterium]|nr:hypothetical protein [Candidatus Paceibacterota bacterium]
MNFFITKADASTSLSKLSNRTLNAVTHEWYSVNFQETFIENPIMITSIETYDGSDPSGVRIQALNKSGMEVMIEEEESSDIEVKHASEIVSYFAVTEGLIRDVNDNIIGEAGKTTKDQSGSIWHVINTQKTYTNPVVFAQMLTYNESHPSHMRLKNIQSDSFEMQIEEWDYLDGDHATEDIGYIVLESGSHELAFGKKLEVGIITADHNWKSVNFDQNFNEIPMTISRCQTYNDSHAVVTRQYNVKATDFSVKLQEAEGSDGTHMTESI